MATRIEHEAEQHGRLLEDEFHAERHVYEPHKAGLPPMRLLPARALAAAPVRLRDGRARRCARSTSTPRSGQLWLLLNPLLLTLRLLPAHRHPARRTAAARCSSPTCMAGLFAYNFLSTSLNAGRAVGRRRAAGSSSTRPSRGRCCRCRRCCRRSCASCRRSRSSPSCTSIARLPVGPHLLWAIPVFAIIAMFTAGMAMLIAALHVYFRDVSSFLPYALRIWLYASPVLYYYAEVPQHLKRIIALNPLTPMFAAWSEVAHRRSPRRRSTSWCGAWPGPSPPSWPAACTSSRGSVSLLSASEQHVDAPAGRGRHGRVGPGPLGHLPDGLRDAARRCATADPPRPPPALVPRDRGGQGRLASRSRAAR